MRAKVCAGEGSTAAAFDVSGRGEDEPAAALEAVKASARLCGRRGAGGGEFALRRMEINACGKRLRLYAELGVNGRFYCMERAGLSAGYLLFACGLDVLNAGGGEQGAD
jgi:hypothetical protein